MTTRSTKKNRNAAILRQEAEQLLSEHRAAIREQAQAMLSKSGTDLKLMSSADIETLVFEFQVHQIELELQNEELKRAHQELGASRDNFAQIYDLSPVAYLTLDDQGIIKKANMAAAQLLGCSKEALVNMKFGKFIYPSDQDNYYFYIHDLVMGKNNSILNTQLVIKNRASIHAECQGYALYGCSRAFCSHNNQSTYVELRGVVNNGADDLQICLAIQDITEYKHTQETISCLNEKLEQKIVEQTSALIEGNRDLTKKIEELEYSKRQLWEREVKLNTIFNASIEGIISIDSSGVIVSVNSAVKTIFGYPEEELIGCTFSKLMSEAENKKQGHNLAGYLQDKIPHIIGQIREVEGRRSDGSLVPVDLTVAEFSIDGVSCYTGIVRDVSLRKMQEKQDRMHLDELAHVTRIGLMGEMASGIAHEINQPLTAIVSYAQACLNFIQVEKPDLVQLSETLRKTLQQALRAGQIIHHMRDFVKSKAIHRSTIDVNNLIHISISLCASDLKHNGIIPRLKLANNLPAVAIDSVQIEQVLLNLIRNSIDALKSLPPETLRQLDIQTYLNSDNDIEFRVRDNGPGIAEIDQEKILTPFFTTKPDGMGMGLSICNSIVRAHQGIMSFNSKPGKGTTFYFTLPTHGKLNG